MPPITKKDLQDKSIEELQQIASDMRAKRAPDDDAEPKPEPVDDLRKQLSSMPVDALKEIHGQLKAKFDADNQPTPENGNRYEGMARSVLASKPGVDGDAGPVGSGSYGLSEPIISGVKAAAETLSTGNASGESMKDMLGRLVKNYNDEMALGQDYQKRYPAKDIKSTAARSAVSAATFGLSEPVASGANAVMKTVQDEGFSGLVNDLDALKANYSADVRARNKNREEFPEADIAGQAAGAFFGPSGVLRKGGALVFTKFAPGLLSKGEAAVAKYFAENPTVMKKIIQEGGRILGAGLKTGADVAEGQAIRNAALSKGGFEDEKDQINPLQAGITGTKFGSAVAIVPAMGRALGAAGKFGMTNFLGPSEADINYYLQNFERLKGENPNVRQVAEEINSAVGKIKDDFTAKTLTRDQAQQALNDVTDMVKANFAGDNQTLRNSLAAAKKDLDLAFREEKATLDAFKRSLPQRNFDDVADSVEQVRQQARQGKQIALGVLAGSKEQIPLGKTVVELEDGSSVSLPGVIDQLKQIKQSYNIAGKGTALGQEARNAQSTIDSYIAQVKKMGDQVSASKLRNMVDQLDDDITALSSITGISAKPDATLMALRKNLDQRLAVVPGWSEAIGSAREAAQALERVSQYVKQPEDIVSLLKNIGEDQNFLGRDVLHELGQRTGKDFTKISDEAKTALDIARSPRALEDIKQGLPEAQKVRDLEGQLAEATDPRTAKARLSAKVQGTDEWLKLQDAQAQVDNAKKTHDMFKNWNEMNVDSKMKSIMNGKEALKAQLGTLSQMSDKDFVQAVDDLRTLIAFNKQYRMGSRNVNLWGALGTASNTGDINSKKMAIGTVLGSLVDNFGPRMAREILNKVGTVQGMITAEKINNMDLPDFIKSDLQNQFARALYYGANSPKPKVTVGPQEAAAIRLEIQRSKSLSNIEKARQLSNLNKYGQVDTTKVLLGGADAPLVTPDDEPNQIDAEDPNEQLYRQPPTVPEIMSRLKSR